MQHVHAHEVRGVRGHQAFTRPASPGILFLARSCDALLTGALVLGGIAAVQASPVPRPGWAVSWLAAFAGMSAFSRAVLGRTPGELIWNLRPRPDKESGALLARLWCPQLRQTERYNADSLASGTFLTLLLVLVLGTTARRALFTHPLWNVSKASEFEPFAPDTSDWTVAPFFYALGAWPTRISGTPVFHVVPYEKGPPQRFPGRIIARWDPPQTKLTFEGPKTPGAGAASAVRARIQECFRPRVLPSASCLAIRETVLTRHMKEMESSLPGMQRGDLRVQWFVVRNPALPESEQAQGLKLHAQLAEKAQERFVLITPQGTHQAFILDYPRNDAGWLSLSHLEKSIRSLRVSDDLNPGRAWIDARLERVRLSDLSSLEGQPEKFLAALSEIELLLLSKISVDPATFESYFHLGGLGLTLLKHAVKHPESGRGDDWKAVARPVIEAAARFGEDVKPSDPRLPQLRNFALEAQKF